MTASSSRLAVRPLWLLRLLLLSSCFCAPAFAQFANISDTGITDENGVALANGQECFTPVNKAGTPIAASYPGGTITKEQRCFPVTGGILQPGVMLVRSDKTLPLNLCYQRIIKNSVTTKTVIGPADGWGCVQVFTDLNMNTVPPNATAFALLSPGPPGPIGPPGQLIPPNGVNLVNLTSCISGSPSLISGGVDASVSAATACTGIPVQGASTVTTNQAIEGDTAGGGHGYSFLDANNNPISTAGPATTLIATSFNEGAPGASLIGLKPATSSTGNVWTEISGGVAPTFTPGGVNVNQSSGGQPTLIDLGTPNFVANVQATSVPDSSQLVFRYVDANNYLAINLFNGHTDLYDGENGAFNLCGKIGGGGISEVKPLVITLSGTAFTVNDNVHPPVTCTLPSNSNVLQSGKTGFTNQYVANPLVLGSLSATTIPVNPATSGVQANGAIAVPGNALTLSLATTGNPSNWMVVRGSVLPPSYWGYWLGGAGSSSGSQTGSAAPSKVVYTSTQGLVSDSTGTPGAQVEGVDQAAKLQALLNGGNVWVHNDGCYTLGTSLILDSTTRFTNEPWGCLLMKTASNAEMFVNRHQNAPTTPSGTGGFLVSNQVDHDIFLENYGTFNFNSTNAVTGSDSFGGNNIATAHKDNPATGKQINGVYFDAVNNLKIRAGEMFDSATFTITLSNDSHVDIFDGNLHHPSPMVVGKNTDGVHAFGPEDAITIRNMDIAAGDDSIGLNADDVSNSGTYGFNYNGTQFPGVKNGPITNVLIDTIRLRGALSGIRELSATEFEDNVEIRNVTGTTLGPSFVGTSYFSGAPGNFGKTRITGWEVESLGQANVINWDPVIANFELSGNWASFELGDVVYRNPVLSTPLISYYGSSTMQHLSWGKTSIVNPAGANIPVLANFSGKVNRLSLEGLELSPAAGWTGSVFGGSTLPNLLSVSNYNGPGATVPLASGWSGVAHRGDGFTATVGAAAPTYVLQTAFTEGAAGAVLTGTKPATYTGPGTGWLQPSGTASTYRSGGGAILGVNNTTDPTLIDIGKASYTSTVTVASFAQGYLQVRLRYTDTNNYIACLFNGGGIAIYDGVNGSFTPIGQTSGAPPLNSPISISVSGNQVTINDGVNAAVTASLPSGSTNTTSSRIGITQAGGSAGATILSAMTVQ